MTKPVKIVVGIAIVVAVVVIGVFESKRRHEEKIRTDQEIARSIAEDKAFQAQYGFVIDEVKSIDHDVIGLLKKRYAALIGRVAGVPVDTDDLDVLAKRFGKNRGVLIYRLVGMTNRIEYVSRIREVLYPVAPPQYLPLCEYDVED